MAVEVPEPLASAAELRRQSPAAPARERARPGGRLRLHRFAPFALVLGVEALFVVALVAGRRGVVGHDAFQYFSLQYVFLSNAAASGETALWMPLVTHGTVANWWYAVQAGLLQSAMLALGPLNRLWLGADFLPLYYLGILVDLAVFLLGVCLLARRTFTSSAAVLFTAIAAVGSSLYFTQPWYNLHFVYALPLVLELGHRLVDRRQWRYLLAAGVLFALQGAGNLPYLLPMIALVVLVYAGAYAVLYWRETREAGAVLLRNWRWSIVPLGVVAAALAVMRGVLRLGTEEIVNYNTGRRLDGTSVSLEAFLEYGTNSNLRWHEAFTRISPLLDYNLYFGVLAAALALLSLLVRPSRRQVLILVPAIFTLLVSLATPVAALLYYTFPMMAFYRHLSLASSIVRLFLAFLAGFGFERFVLGRGAPAQRRVDRLRLLLVMAVLGTVAARLAALATDPSEAAGWVATASVGWLPLEPRALEPAVLMPMVVRGALWSAGAAGVLALLLARWPRARALTAAVVLFQAVDVYAFRLELGRHRTVALDTRQADVNRLQPMPYAPRREPVDYARHPRGAHVPQNTYGAVYWTADSFLFTDPPANLGRTDHWLWSLDDFLRTYHGEALRDTRGKPRAFRVYEAMLFPTAPQALELAGVTEDKLQFFRAAHSAEDPRAISAAMRSPLFAADLLLLEAAEGCRGLPLPRGFELAMDEQVALPHRVVGYDANHVEIEVDAGERGAWLYYADSWHPSWRARVNGMERAVCRANLGYKAVRLDPGPQRVELRFHSPRMALYVSLVNLLSLGCLVGCAFLVVTLWREGGEGAATTPARS